MLLNAIVLVVSNPDKRHVRRTSNLQISKIPSETSKPTARQIASVVTETLEVNHDTTKISRSYLDQQQK